MRNRILGAIAALALACAQANASDLLGWKQIEPLTTAPFGDHSVTPATTQTVRQELDARVMDIIDLCPPAGLVAGTDNSVCIQASLNAMATSGGSLQVGPYVVDITNLGIAPGVYINGSGRGTGSLTPQGGDTTPPFFGTFKERLGTTGTLIQCKGSAASCLRFNPNSQGNYYDGGGLRNLAINALPLTNTFAIEQDNLRNAVFENLTIWKPTNAIYSKGGNEVRFRNIYLQYFQNAPPNGLIDLESGGAAGGEEGGLCGNASTDPYGVICRSDAVSFEDVVAQAGAGMTSGACIKVNDFSATAQFRHIRFINCWDGIISGTTNTSTVNGGPSFLDLEDFQMDFCHHICGYFSDTQDIWIHGGSTYFHGAGDATNVNTLVFNCGNWCGTSQVGKVWIDGATIDGAQGTCVAIFVPAVFIHHNFIRNCNLAGHALGVDSANIALSVNGGWSGGVLGQAIIDDNSLCQDEGYVSGPQDGIWVAPYMANNHIHDNGTSACRTPVTFATPTGANNDFHDNN